MKKSELVQLAEACGHDSTGTVAALRARLRAELHD